MNTQKIKFFNGDTAKEIEVKGVFPYLVNSAISKVVLRMTISEEDVSYDDIYALKSCTGIIEQYERTIDGEIVGEWELKNTYEDYNSGEISIGYQDGQYSVDLTRVGKFEKMLMQNKADIEYVAIMADIPLE